MAVPATAFVGWVWNAIVDGAAAETVNAGLVTVGSTPLDAVSCFEPASVTDRAGNEARPAASLATPAPPLNVPVPTSVSATLVPATVLPNASVTRTCTGGAIAAPATTLEGGVWNASVAGAAAATVNDVLVTDGSTPLVAVSCLSPTRFRLSALNVARPAASLSTAVPPDSVPLPTSDSATLVPATLLPSASVTRTCTAGAIAAPATTLLGWVWNASVAAGPAAIVNAVLVAGVSTPLAAVSCFEPVRLTLSALNVARPVASVRWAAPPVSAPVPTSASVTLPPGTPLPNASASSTWTAGAIVEPATALLGWTGNDNVVAAAGATMNAVLVTDVSAPLEAVSCLEPARLTDSAANVALPAASLSVAPPPVRVPVPTSASVTELPGTLLPNVSVTRTWTAGAIATPAVTLLGATENASVDAAAGETLNAVLVAGVRTPLVAVSCFAPTKLMLRALNVALPAASLNVAAPPLKVPLPTSASATELPATPFPNVSLTLTWTAGAMAAPATTVTGCTAKLSVAAGPAAMVNPELVAGVSAPLDAVNCFAPDRLTLSALKVAIPLVSLTMALPPVSVPVPTRPSVTELPAMVLPNASVTRTWTAGAIVAPAMALEGCTANASTEAAAGETVKVSLVSGVSRPSEAVSCLEPTRFTDSALNVALPFASVASGPPPVTVPVPTSVSVTDAPGTLLPSESAACTWTAGATATPATTAEGWVENANEAGGPAETTNGTLTTFGKVPLAARSCFEPVTPMLRSLKVAMPAASAIAESVPESVPVPTSDSVTVSPGRMTAARSMTRTCTAGVIVDPATTVEGWTTNERPPSGAVVSV